MSSFSSFGCEGRRARKGMGSRGSLLFFLLLLLFLRCMRWVLVVMLRPSTGREGEAAHSPGGRLIVEDPEKVVDHDPGCKQHEPQWKKQHLFCCNWKGREETGAGREVGLDEVRLQPSCCLQTHSHVPHLPG